MATTTSTPEAILDAVGGAENIIHFTHCATRLRFELKDASGIDKAAVEAIPGVMGAVPQSGDRYQIVIGGAVQSVYDEINNLPAMKSRGGSSGSGQSDADGKADLMVCIINFAGTPHEGYRVGLPFAGDWEEVLNTDSEEYGGSGVGNLGHVEAEDLPWNGRPASVRLRVPPMGAVFLRPAQD